MGRFNRGASTNIIHIISDCIFGSLAFVTALLVSGHTIQDSDMGTYAIACFTFMIIFLLANKESRLYNVTTFFYTDRIVRYVSKSFIIATGVSSTLLFYAGKSDIDRKFYILFLIAIYVLGLVSAFTARYIAKRVKLFAPRTVLIGAIEDFDKFNHFLRRSNMEVDIIGYVGVDSAGTQTEYLGNIEDLESIIHKNGIDQVYIMHKRKDDIDIQPYINMCMEMGVTIRIIINNYKGGGAQSYVSSVGTYPVLTYHRVSLNSTSRAIKRIVDIIGALCGIILASPLMLGTAIAVKLDSKGPVIFKQERVGLNGRHFHMYKFRSMCQDAEAKKKELMQQNEVGSGLMFKIHDDPRITKVGKFIRKTSLDELPQFFNVLKGDMSLVGTRPPTLDEVAKYERNHWRRMSIKPGITGMWQVSGRSQITDFDEIVELDTEYIDKWSVGMDFKIMLKTGIQLLTHRGAC